MKSDIPSELLDSVYNNVEFKYGTIPFKLRGIKVTHELIRVTVEILNNEFTKTLPQNSRNASKDKTPDGLDKRIKDSLNIDLRTANIISDVLKESGIVEIITVENHITGRGVKGTRLLSEWCW